MEISSPSKVSNLAKSSPQRIPLVGRVSVIRGGSVDPYVAASPTFSSASVQWENIALEDHTLPPVLIPQHQHPLHFMELVLRGTVKYEVLTTGQTRRFTSQPDTILLVPRGTVDEVTWGGSTHCVLVAIHPRLLVNALDETAHRSDIELTEHWDLVDHHISALLLEMSADLRDGSPAGRMYGESLANTLAVYLIKRYAVRRQIPAAYSGGLPRFRLNRVLDFIEANLCKDLGLGQIATVAGMSPHYFSELFKQSMGHAPHEYVLIQRVERAKQWLRDPECSIIAAGLNAGFRNPSHFAHMFRRIVGVTPSMFRSRVL